MADSADERTGVVLLTPTELVAETGLSMRNVHRLLAALEGYKLISRARGLYTMGDTGVIPGDVGVTRPGDTGVIPSDMGVTPQIQPSDIGVTRLARARRSPSHSQVSLEDTRKLETGEPEKREEREGIGGGEPGIRGNAVLPEWYGVMWTIPGFKPGDDPVKIRRHLARCEAWLTKNAVADPRLADLEHLVRVARDLASKWPGNPKRPYRVPWLTYQNWVTSKPRNQNGGGSGIGVSGLDELHSAGAEIEGRSRTSR